ncbi:MAG TPA: type II secretion system F family protein [Clostridiales bacterium]|nr:type II secretion system F family protein [Clostridiales bacterium]
MPIYNYECISRIGETVTGKLSAENDIEAADKLKKMQLTVVDISAARSGVLDDFLSTEKKVKEGELAIFSRQLASMLKSGIPVTRALYTLSAQGGNPTLTKALSNIAREVESGMALTEAFMAYPKIFPKLYISMIEVGELGGLLDQSLTRLADQMEKEKALKDSIKAATFYPKMVFGFASLILIAMMTFLVPMFKGFIPDTSSVPAITQAIFNMSEVWLERWYVVVLIVVLLIVIFQLIKNKDGVKRFLEKVRYKIPGFGPLLEKAVVARFCRTFSTLMAGGIPVVQALQSAAPTAGSYILEDAIVQAAKRIEDGGGISKELGETEAFPPMVVHMTAVGEESGRLPELLDSIAEFYETEVTTLTKGLSAVIEPLMLIIVGLVVGGMLIALYLPIFSVVTAS